MFTKITSLTLFAILALLYGFLSACPPTQASKTEDEKELDRAQAIWAKGHKPEAIEAASTLIARSPNYFPARVARGEYFANIKNWSRCLLDEQKTVELTPKFQHGWILVAMCQANLNNPNEAMKNYRKAIACPGRETGIGHRELALLLSKTDKPSNLKEALVEVNKALAADVNEPSLEPFDLSARGIVYDAFARFPLLKPGVPVNPEIARIRAAGDKERKLMLQNLIRREPDNAEAHAIFGDVYAQEMEYGKAFRELQIAVKLAPAYQRGYELMGWSQLQLGNFTDSIAFFDRAISIDGVDTGNAHRDKGNALVKLGKNKEALVEVNKAIELHTDRIPQVHDDICLRVVIEKNLKDYQALLKDTNQKLEMDKEVFSADWQERGDAYALLGKLDLAKSDYLKAIKIAPENRDALSGLVKVYEKNGETAKAQAYKKQLKELDYGGF